MTGLIIGCTIVACSWLVAFFINSKSHERVQVAKDASLLIVVVSATTVFCMVMFHHSSTPDDPADHLDAKWAAPVTGTNFTIHSPPIYIGHGPRIEIWDRSPFFQFMDGKGGLVSIDFTNSLCVVRYSGTADKASRLFWDAVVANFPDVKKRIKESK